MEVVIAALQAGSVESKNAALKKFNQTYENYNADGDSNPVIESKFQWFICSFVYFITL